MGRILNHIEHNIVKDKLSDLKQIKYTFKKLGLDTDEFNKLVEELYDEMITNIIHVIQIGD